MPIFEYRCKDCNSKYEVLHKSSVNLEAVSCPECNSTEYVKLLSAFSASVNSSSYGDYSGDSCATGSCGIPSPVGGCSTGMCGLN